MAFSPTPSNSSPVSPKPKLVGVLRHPRSRFNPASTESSGHHMDAQHQRILKRDISDMADRNRIQSGDEGYKRGIINFDSSDCNHFLQASIKSMGESSNKGSARGSISTSASRDSDSFHRSPFVGTQHHRVDSLLDENGKCHMRSVSECEAWRKDGQERRMKILQEDDLNGGSDFRIHYQSPLRTYSDIADRIRDQFQRAYSSSDITTEELQCIYIMGNRLINFLSKVLPTHPQYASKRPDHVRLQVKIQHDLMTVREKVDHVAYRLDKEFYRQKMEEEGLEYIKTPEKSAREMRKERIKRVTFNLDLERIEYEPYVYEKQEWNEGTEKDDFHDLSMWEDRDPDDGDFIDMSLSSEDSSFESSFRFECKSYDHVNHQSQFSNLSASDVGDEVLDVFGGTDDGWEHCSSNGVNSRDWEWPDMLPSHGTIVAFEKDQDTTASTVDMDNSSNEQDQTTPFSLRKICRTDSDESESDYECEGGDINNFFSGINESFVEKICRENFSRSIDELQDNDDDSAQDSWAQQCQKDDDSHVLNDDVVCDHFYPSKSEFGSPVASIRLKDDDMLESPIDGHITMNEDEKDLSMSSIDGPRRSQFSFDNLPRAQDVLGPVSRGEESLEYSMSSLDFSYPSSKNSSKLYLSSCTEEWDNSELETSGHGQLLNINDEFDSSQIIAASPSFDDQSESGNEDNEYNDFVRTVADEFSSHAGESIYCDSSGGEKTITTTSTADTSCETVEGNSCGSQGSVSQGKKESVLGILRRDSYIPTIDSPQRPGKKLGDNLDYLESKVKDLSFRNVEKDSRAYQRGAESPKRKSNLANRCSDLSNELDAKTATGNLLDYSSHETVVTLTDLPKTSTSTPRQHPTAARLKMLRQSTAWKRRYGK